MFMTIQWNPVYTDAKGSRRCPYCRGSQKVQRPKQTFLWQHSRTVTSSNLRNLTLIYHSLGVKLLLIIVISMSSPWFLIRKRGKTLHKVVLESMIMKSLRKLTLWQKQNYFLRMVYCLVCAYPPTGAPNTDEHCSNELRDLQKNIMKLDNSLIRSRQEGPNGTFCVTHKVVR